MKRPIQSSEANFEIIDHQQFSPKVLRRACSLRFFISSLIFAS
jgi:hypothetical protein